MKLINNPDRSQWAEILKRPVMNTENLFDTVRGIIDRVKSDGDRAVLEMEAKFDKVELTSLAVTEAELKEAETLVDERLKAAIRLAKQNIETFHAAQRFEGKKVETMPGVTCWQKAVAIEKVGLYIPGGTAPLFSTVLMLAVPAKIAGCKEIVLCTPPDKEGRVHPAILFAAQVAGVSRIFKAGGVQAIAAMAYGTESVPKVYKIFGPGNQYVTAAKQLVSLRDVAIDMPAALKIRLTPATFAANNTAGCTFPSRPGGVQRTISLHPAILAGTASISTVENSGAVPPGIYNPTFSMATAFCQQVTPG